MTVARQSLVAINLDEIEWQPITEALGKGGKKHPVENEGDGVGVGFLLREDDDTGAFTSLTKAPPGLRGIAPESHSANQAYWVIEGDLKLGDVALRAGSFIYIPAGTIHGPGSTENGCISLAMFDGPFDIQYHDLPEA